MRIKIKEMEEIKKIRLQPGKTFRGIAWVGPMDKTCGKIVEAEPMGDNRFLSKDGWWYHGDWLEVQKD